MLSEIHKTQFSMLVQAAVNGDLQLIETTTKDGGPIAILGCLLLRDDATDETPETQRYELFAIAKMFAGDPLIEVNQPTADAQVATIAPQSTPLGD